MNRLVRRAAGALLIVAGALWIALPGLCVLAFGGGSRDFLGSPSATLRDVTNPFALAGLLVILGGVILLFWRPRDDR